MAAHLVSYFSEKKNKQLAVPSAQMAVKKTLSKLGIDDECVPASSWSRFELPIRSGSATDLRDPSLYAAPTVAFGRSGGGRLSGTATPMIDGFGMKRKKKVRTVSCSFAGTASDFSDDEEDDVYREFSSRSLYELKQQHTSALNRLNNILKNSILSSSDSVFDRFAIAKNESCISTSDDDSDSDASPLIISSSNNHSVRRTRSGVADATMIDHHASVPKPCWYVEQLPVELLEMIFKNVSTPTLGIIAQVCKKWASVVASDYIQQQPSFKLEIRFAKYRTGQATPNTFFTTSDEQINALAIQTTSKGQELMYLTAGATVLVIDRKTGRHVRDLEGHTDQVCAIATSQQDGRVFTAGFDKTIKAWSEDGDELFSLAGHSGAIRALVVSPCGKFLYSGSHDKMVRIWSIDTTQQANVNGNDIPDEAIAILEGHRSGVYALAMSPSGNRLYSGAGSKDSRIHVWSKTGELLDVLNDHQGGIFALACGPDGRIYSGSVDKTVRIWSPEGRLQRTIRGHRFTIQSLAIDTKNRLYSGSIDTTVRVCDATTGRYIQTLCKHTEAVSAFAVAPCGRVFSASHDKSVLLW